MRAVPGDAPATPDHRDRHPLEESLDEQRRTTVRFSVLGPLQVEVAGRPVPLGPPKQRLVLAMLLCCPNRPVSLELLTEAVWQDEPPRTARKNLHVYVSALRRLLGDEAGEGGDGDRARIVHDYGGYCLRTERSEYDVSRFQDLAQAGRTAAVAGELDAAAGLFRQALDLWQGDPFAGLRCSPMVRAEAARLEERCLGGYEDWAETELERGGAIAAVAEGVGELIERHPLRERLQAARMNTLHVLGRQAEALAAYDRYRQLLARELGLSPSPALERQYRRILAARRGGGRPGPAGGPARTVLPPDTADFTGRTEQVRELRELLVDGGRVAALVGPAGIGKTTLAVRIAHLLQADFPEGRMLVRSRTEDGSPRSWQEVLGDVARLAGMAEQPADDPCRTVARWHAWLADRRVLLILDDVPDETVARALLPADGVSAAVVTSRVHLAGLAPVHRVEPPPYSPDEALELLGRIIGPDRLRSDLAAAEEIVDATGMLPLAVRAGGLKLAVLRHLPLREYAARLADPDAVLDELAAGDVAVRPHLARCWRELTPSGRAALLRLARLPLARPFTLAEAAAALHCDESAALRELEALISAGMVTSPVDEVTAHRAVYAVPRLIHLYAREGAAPPPDRPQAHRPGHCGQRVAR
ncbi:BTAD domain-containing putative transcriptional regulator [Streptomyces sp. BE20]|uniref:AfsR/SARP family transcriptional regulator n=1 Tax=Streptomyces sp. BE20 TaxID=3002525 RepID=UPI002E793FF3|nr:BTAD domain-containing putative transcriptional regulator [Streptomyces sp. BE20]MEE1827995.1 BTAD domain-containing putative transcriptional regulator [Streptomyces sp. BE20]